MSTSSFVTAKYCRHYDMHNIVRLAYKRTNKRTNRRTKGWYVRFERDGKSVRKLFSDGIYGGIDKALHAAIAFRDDVEPRMPKAKLERKVLSQGKIRLRAVRSRTKKLHKRFLVWFPEADGYISSTSFSVGKHGYQRAQRLAREWLATKQAA